MKRKKVGSEDLIEEILISFTTLGIVRHLPLSVPKIGFRNSDQGWNEPLIQGAPTLAQQLARADDWRQIPLTLPPWVMIKLSSGGQNSLAKKVISEFCSRFTPGGKLVHIGNGENGWSYSDEHCLRRFSVVVRKDGELPDVVVHSTKMNWIVLIQLATSQGPVNGKRLAQLSSFFGGSELKLVFVSAFLNRRDFSKCRRKIAWGTHVWVADAPNHMIHFDGERLPEPYLTPSA